MSYRLILEQASQDQREIIELHERIEKAAGILEIEPASHAEVQSLLEAVKTICLARDTLRQGWMMAGRIASLRSAPDLVLAFSPYADAWLEVALEYLANNIIDEREISAVPSMFYVVGDLDRAIDYAYDIINGPLAAKLGEERKKKINFNRAAFLIEREYHSPTTHVPSRESLKKDIELILDEAEAMGLAHMHSAILDTRGLSKIAFAKTKDEVRLGIEECIKARGAAPPDE